MILHHMYQWHVQPINYIRLLICQQVLNQTKARWLGSPWHSLEKEQFSCCAGYVAKKVITGHLDAHTKILPPQTDAFVDKPPTSDATMPTGTTKGTYVPPSLRAGAERPAVPDMRRRNEENSVRVTNLSEDTREPDLLELFRTFGPVSRVYVAIDQKTGVSRGFGFVNFVSKKDAEREQS